MALKWNTCVVGPVGTNCYMLCDDGRDDCVIVDPGDEADRIREMAGARRIAAVLLTHGHFDHIAALPDLYEEGMHVYVHACDADMIMNPETNVSLLFLGVPQVGVRATHTLADGDAFSEAGLRFTCIHTPGHTPGSCCYQCGDVMLTGDTVMSAGVGRTDLPGGSAKQMRDSLRKLSPMLEGKQLLGGHG